MEEIKNTTFTEGELSTLMNYLSKAKFYLEYGTGYSTKVSVNQKHISKIIAIESDLNFINSFLLKDSDIQANLNERLHIQHINVGETASWGAPVNRMKSYIYPLYTLTPLSYNIPFDLILVDGIFRGACILNAILNFKQAIIIVHDFSIRKRYQYLLKYIEIIDSVDTMIVCKRKSNLDDSDIIRILKRKLYWPQDERWYRRLQRK